MAIKHKKKISKQENNNGIHQEIRNVGVLVEHLDSKISLAAEQYGDIKKTLNQHTEILDQHTEMFDSMKTTLAQHTETLAQHTEMIGSIKTDIEIIKMDIEFIKGSLKQKVDVEEFSALERRVALLESGR